MATKISSYAALTTPDDADLLVIVDDDAGATKKITVANLLANAVGLKQVGQTTVAGAAVTTASVSGLDGDTEGIHLLHVLWKQASTIGSMTLEPNGTSTNQQMQTGRVTGGTADGAQTAAIVVLSGAGSVAAGDWHEAWILCRVAAGQPRQFFSFYYKQSSGDGSGSLAGWVFSTWNDTSTNVTSYDFVASVASSIDVGSIFTVYQVTHDAL